MVDPITLSFLTVFGILLLSLVCCSVCVACVCPVALLLFIPAMLFQTCFRSQHSTYRRIYHHHHLHGAQSAPQQAQIHVAEAFLVAPLAEVRKACAFVPNM